MVRASEGEHGRRRKGASDAAATDTSGAKGPRPTQHREQEQVMDPGRQGVALNLGAPNAINILYLLQFIPQLNFLAPSSD